MTVGPLFFAPQAGGGGDPFFASVILLMPGSDFLDHSSHANSMSVGANLSIDSSVPNGVYGTSSMRAAASGVATQLKSAVSAFWRAVDVPQVLEFDLYIDSLSPPIRFLISDTNSDAVPQYIEIDAGPVIATSGYFSSSGAAVSVGAWLNFALVYDGPWDGAHVNHATYVNRVIATSGGGSKTVSASDQNIDVTGNGFGGADQLRGRLMNVRYTRGTTRGYPSALSQQLSPVPLPDPLGPWPTHA